MRSSIIIAFFILFFNGCKSGNEIMNISTIQQLDLQQYLGTWYEVARYDHRFERGLVGVTATYSLRNDGKIMVVNRGFKNSLDGKPDVATGKAKLTDEPGKLKVSFFWFFYGDYYILELEENYQWVLIGSSSDKYLWILSRTPQLEESIKSNILEKARGRGYDVSKLIWVKQKEQ